MGQCSLHPFMWRKKKKKNLWCSYTSYGRCKESSTAIQAQRCRRNSSLLNLDSYTCMMITLYSAGETMGRLMISSVWLRGHDDIGVTICLLCNRVWEQVLPGIPSRIHVTLCLREVGDYRKIKETQSGKEEKSLNSFLQGKRRMRPAVFLGGKWDPHTKGWDSDNSTLFFLSSDYFSAHLTPPPSLWSRLYFSSQLTSAWKIGRKWTYWIRADNTGTI